MHRLIKLSEEEILEIFNTYYFLETSTHFICCIKESHRTKEIISKEDMQYLNSRYFNIDEKKKNKKHPN